MVPERAQRDRLQTLLAARRDVPPERTVPEALAAPAAGAGLSGSCRAVRLPADGLWS
jgi:hypothetical protein